MLLMKAEDVDLSKYIIKFIDLIENSSSKQGVEFIEPIDIVEINGYVLELHYEGIPRFSVNGRLNYVIRKIRHLQNNNAICPLCKKPWSMAMECRIDRDSKELLASQVAMKSLFPENDS